MLNVSDAALVVCSSRLERIVLLDANRLPPSGMGFLFHSVTLECVLALVTGDLWYIL